MYRELGYLKIVPIKEYHHDRYLAHAKYFYVLVLSFDTKDTIGSFVDVRLRVITFFVKFNNMLLELSTKF